jgi:hypothetical protein
MSSLWRSYGGKIDSLGSWMAKVGMVKTGTLVNEGKIEELRADDAN